MKNSLLFNTALVTVGAAVVFYGFKKEPKVLEKFVNFIKKDSTKTESETETEIGPLQMTKVDEETNDIETKNETENLDSE